MALNFLPPLLLHTVTHCACVSTVLVPYIFYYTAVIIKWASTLLSPNNKYIEIIEINQLRVDSEAEENSIKTASTIAIFLLGGRIEWLI